MIARSTWRSREWPEEIVVELYRTMVRIRQFEREGARRYDAGDFVGPYHPSDGQEATYVGALAPLRPTDLATSTHRSHGHQIAKGASLPALAAEIWGRSTGVCGGKGGSMHLADFAVGAIGASALLGGGLGIAAGAALAEKLSGSGNVVVCFFGDGAVNEGICHEVMNWASIWALPVIFVCENNQYAVTTWYRNTTSVDLVSKRAVAYDMPGYTLDGQNVLEVFAATEAAVERARAGMGPTLLECLTYRYGEHSLRMTLPRTRVGAIPDGGGYRSALEVSQWRNRDPIELLASWAEARGALDGDRRREIDEEELARAREAWAFAESSPWPDEEAIWTDTWADPVPADERVELAPAGGG